MTTPRLFDVLRDDQACRARFVRLVLELRPPFAVCGDDGQHAAVHAASKSEGDGATRTRHNRAFELLRAIAHEAWPILGAGHDRAQRRQHLAAVADAEREAVLAREERVSSSRAR